MGEAKRRAAEIQKLKERYDAWRTTLSPAELVIEQTASRIDERLVRGRGFTEGCYHLAFFMTRYLAAQGIEVTPMIGWVNDGLWDGVASHGWIEYNGKITDASITRTTHPRAVPTGALIVQDFVVRPGHAVYTYHKDDDPVVVKGLAYLQTQPQWAHLMAHKFSQHKMMKFIVNEGRLDDYLSNAPLGSRYSDIAALIS